MLEKFKDFLVKEGYSEKTPSGYPSTVYDYQRRINNILERESITISTLFNDIDIYVQKYDIGGINEDYGKKSHGAFISALKKFKDFKDTP